MADDKLIIPVGFNFNIEEIDKEWQAKKAEIEKALKAEISLTFKMPSTKSLDNLESVVNRLKDLKIEPITPETKDAISSLTRELTTLQKILERIQALNIKSAKDVAATALAEEKITTQRTIAAKNLAQARSSEALAVNRENKALLQQKTLEDQAALVKLRVQKAEESLASARSRSVGTINAQNSALVTQKGILNGMPQFLNQYLSILGAWRLVDNIRKTTADFELQRISLEAIIQDKREADALFSKTLSLAIESPYTAQELISYTKQLSAYRIETDKLYDTTKRLADVAAGLGVDMSRLILAYGQVRAASVLRGQEVRQFTEAGIPLIQLLADKFTVLKDRVVSTSEVFDLISKRQVPFEMVAEVFEDMTNKGGIFYDMQMKQANTLYGIYQKLTDNIQQAFYRVGTTQMSTLKGAGNLMIELSKNLETVLSTGTDIIGVWALWKGYNMLLTNSLTSENTAMTKSIISMKEKEAEMLRQAAAYRTLTAAEKARIATSGALMDADIRNAYVKGELSKEMVLLYTAMGKLDKVEAANILTVKRLTEAELQNAVAKGKMSSSAANAYRQDTKAILDQVDSVKQISSAKLKWITITTRLRSVLKSLTTFLMSNAWFIGIQVIIQIAAAFKRAREEAGKLKEVMSDVVSGGLKEARDLDERFVKLANTITSTNERTQEHQEALKELKGTYGDILPSYVLTNEYLSQMKGNYDGVTASIYEYIKAKAASEGRARIAEEMEEDISSARTKAARWLQSQLKWTAAGEVNDATTLAILDKSRAYIEKGVDMYRALQKAVEDVTGKTVTLGQVYDTNDNRFRKFANTIRTAFNAEIEFDEAMKSAFNSFGVYRDEFEKTLNEIDEIRKEHKPLEISNFAWDESQANKAMVSYNKFLEKVTGHTYLELANNRDLLRSYPENFQGIFDKISKDVSSMFGSDFDTSLRDLFKRVAKGVGLSVDDMSGYIKKFDQTTDQWVDDLEKQVQAAIKYADDLNVQYRKFTEGEYKDASLAPSEDDVSKANKLAKALQLILSQFRTLTKKTGATDNKTATQQLEGEVRVLEEAYKRYQDLKKVRGDSLARADVERLYGDLAKKFKFISPSIATTPEEMIAQLKKAAEIAQKSLDKPKLALSFNMKVSDTSYDALKEGIEKDLKRLANDITLQNEAKKMYESILAATGDVNFAAQITTSTTGLDTLDVFSKLREQLKKTLTAYQTKSGGLIDWDTLFATDEAGNKTVLDIKKVQAAIKELPETVQTSAKSAMNAYFGYEQETVKKMAESVQKFGDYEKRRNIIAAKAAEERARIESSTILTPDQKAQGVEAVNKSERRQIAGVNLDEIKNLEMFAQAFGDLDRVGTKTLGNLTSMMKNFYEASKNDLDPTQLREVVRIIQNLEEQSWERSPFAAIKEGINDILTGTREVQAAEANLAAARAAQAEVEKRNASEIAILRLQMSQAGTDEERATILQRINDLERQNRDAVKNTQQAVEDLAAAEYKVQTGFTKTKAALNKMDAYLGNLSSDIGKIGDAMNTFSDIFGSAFGEEASAMIQDIQKGFQAVQAGIALVNTVMSIADAIAKGLMTTMLPLLAASVALGAVLAIFGARQRRIKEEQEASERAVRKLENAYKDLETAMDRAYSTADINKTAKQQTQNLLNQQKELNRQIDLEYKKKDKDFDQGRVDDMRRQIEELNQQIADNRRELVESFYGTDFKTFSSDLAQAIYDGVKDGSLSAKEAWNETVDEMVDKMILELATAKFIMPGVENIMDSFMEQTRRLNGLSQDELPTLEQFPFEDFREALYAYFGEIWGDFSQWLPDGGESNLTGISKAVGSLTEDTALVLAAAANSMIYYQVAQYDQVVSINAILTGWNELIMGTEETAGLIPTLMASQTESMELLRGIKSDTGRIATATEQMADDIGSVVAPLGSKVGAKAINVNS